MSQIDKPCPEMKVFYILILFNFSLAIPLGKSREISLQSYGRCGPAYSVTTTSNAENCQKT